MANIEIKKDSGLIRVMAEQAAHKTVSYDDAKQAHDIIAELSKDNSPENRHKLAQVVAYTVEKMQEPALDFLGTMADIKNVGYGDKVMFNIKTDGIKAFYQAKGATTARSYISEKQFTMGTEAISARPAINVIDLWTGRVNMADLIAQANREITYAKLSKVEQVLVANMQTYASPFYASGLTKANLDAMLAYFNRIGPVTLLGDRAAVQQIAGLIGWSPLTPVVTANPVVSDELINEYNDTGLIGKYLGNSVVVMPNGYRDQSTTPILDATNIYIIPGGIAADQRNLKIVNEGPVQSFESQNIDDLTFEIRLEQWFGVGFISGGNKTVGGVTYNTGRNPNMGLLEI